MTKIPVLGMARKLERAFRPLDLCSVDDDYHVFTVAYTGQYPEHTHEADEFVYILEGELQVEVEGETRHLRQGDAILIPAGIPHRPVCQGRALGLVFERRGLQHGNDTT